MSFLAVAAGASAQWVEVGDAGQLLGSAQTVTGGGPLTTIQGTIVGDSDVDLYRFIMSSPGTFSAHTEGAAFTMEDTQLFLFNSSGNGVAFNDDIDTFDENYRSRLEAGSSLYASLAAGTYYIAVGEFDNDPYWQEPFEASDYIFPFVGDGMAVGPNTGAGPLVGWDSELGLFGGTYQITFTGASAVPEPATLSAMALGVAALVRRRRANRR